MSIPIDMMDNFFILQPAPDLFFCNHTMLKSISVLISQMVIFADQKIDISVLVYALSALPVR
jgi:hypothetical protein